MTFLDPAPAANTRTPPCVVDVQFKLTDLDYQPVGDDRVRLVLGRIDDWQSRGSGREFVTDANGEQRFTTTIVLEERTIRRPTNFIDGLFRRAEPVDFLPVAAELEYAGHRWLYVFELHRFRRGGDVMLGGSTIFSADPSGRYTRKATCENGVWFVADLGGRGLTHPGHELWEFTLATPDAASSDSRWTLRIALKRAPEPIVR